MAERQARRRSGRPRKHEAPRRETPLGELRHEGLIDAEQYRAGFVFACLDHLLRPAADGCPEALPFPHLVELVAEQCPALWDLADVQFRPAVQRRVEELLRQCYARMLADPGQAERTLIRLQKLPPGAETLRNFRRDLNALARVCEIPRSANGLTLDEEL